MRQFWYALATLLGTIIGAGILGIPYAATRSGFFIALGHIIVIGALVCVLNLYLGEIVLRTKGRHQLVGYASIYLGKPGKAAMLLLQIGVLWGALTAYIIGEGSALAALFEGSPAIWSFAFWLAGAALIWRGLRTVAASELALGGLKFLVLAALLAVLFPQISAANLSPLELGQAAYPVGVVLFAFLGFSAIPEVRELLWRRERTLKTVLLAGSGIPIIVYVLFVAAIVGTTGPATPELATAGLRAAGMLALGLGNLFAVLTMATVFLALGLVLRDLFEYDVGLPRQAALAAAVLPPLAAWLAGAQSFAAVLGISGALFGGGMAVLVVLMHRAAARAGKRAPEYAISSRAVLDGLLVVLFVAGAVAQLLLI